MAQQEHGKSVEASKYGLSYLVKQDNAFASA